MTPGPAGLDLVSRSATLATSILLALLSLGCADPPAGSVPAEPKPEPALTFSKVLRWLRYVPLSLSGLAFHDDRLFVASNFGLLIVRDRAVEGIYTWFDYDDVVSGPWLDGPRNALWLKREHDGQLIRLDQAGWRFVTTPVPPRGSYSRADVLTGFRGVSEADFFRLVAGGHVFTRLEADVWRTEESPPAEEFSRTVGFATVASQTLHIVEALCASPPCRYAAYWRRDGTWQPAKPLPITKLQEMVATSEAVYVRGGRGELLRVTPDGVELMKIHGLCDAIAVTSDGRVIASFRGTGLFRLESTWTRLASAPYSAPDDDHFVHLTERGGSVALARTPFKSRGSLWVLDGQQLVRVDLPW